MADNPRTVPGARTALSIAISDPTGVGGIQGDLKTFAAVGIYGMGVPVAISIQNTVEIKKTIALETETIEEQLAVLTGDMNIHAVKVGALRDKKTVETVARFIRRQKLYPLVLAPAFLNEKPEETMLQAILKKLVPEAALLIVNCEEAAQLLDRKEKVDSVAAATECAKRLYAAGASQVIVGGLRLDNDHEGDAVDIFYDGSEVTELVSDWRPTRNVGGAGEVFSAAITAGLANEMDVKAALELGKSAVSEAVRQTTDLGKGASPVHHSAIIKVK